MTKEILILGHLGLGDVLIQNALVRHYAQTHLVTFVTKSHNKISTAFMFRDDPRITVVDVEDDKEARELAREVKSHGKEVLALGLHASPPTIPLPPQPGWDSQLYTDAKVPFENRWNNFKVMQQPSMEVETPKCRFTFVHDDAKRGFKIKDEFLPSHCKIVRVDPAKSDNIFAWWTVLQNAWEIHCIESSFAILVDSLPNIKAKRKVLHLYARKSTPPNYRTDWEIIK